MPNFIFEHAFINILYNILQIPDFMTLKWKDILHLLPKHVDIYM
jgi:hypothetical protein